MSVFNPGQPNLSSNYANIQQALEQSANIAGKNTGPLGTAAAIATPVAAEAQRMQEEKSKRELETFKSALNDQLNEHQTKYTAEAVGRSEYTQPDIDEFWKTHNLPEEAKPTIKGKVFLSDEDVQKHVSLAEQRVAMNALADEVEKTDPKRAKALRALGVPGVKADSAEQVRKIAFPEDEIAKSRPTKSKDSFGRDINVYPDGTTQVLNGAVKEVPAGQQAKSQANLRPAETKTFNQGVKDVQKLTKESKKTFDDLDKFEKDVDAKNPLSFYNNKIALVKLGGISAGRIAQGEIVQEAGARDFISKMNQKLEALTRGDWTTENRKLIKKYITTLKKVETEHLKNTLENGANTVLSQMPDPQRIDPSFIKKELSSGLESYLPLEFDTVEEAEAAGLKKGTRVVVGGHGATIQ